MSFSYQDEEEEEEKPKKKVAAAARKPAPKKRAPSESGSEEEVPSDGGGSDYEPDEPVKVCSRMRNIIGKQICAAVLGNSVCLTVFRIRDILRGIRILLFSSVAFEMPTRIILLLSFCLLPVLTVGGCTFFNSLQR